MEKLSIIVGTTDIKTTTAERLIELFENNLNGVTVNVEYSGENYIDAIELSGEFTEETVDYIYNAADEYGAEVISIA